MGVVSINFSCQVAGHVNPPIRISRLVRRPIYKCEGMHLPIDLGSAPDSKKGPPVIVGSDISIWTCVGAQGCAVSCIYQYRLNVVYQKPLT